MKRMGSSEKKMHRFGILTRSLLIINIALVLGPILLAFLAAFYPEGQTEMGTSIWDLTLANFKDVYTSKEYLRPLWHTLILAVLTTMLSLCLGTALAWLIKRTDLRWGSKLEPFVVIPFFLSPFTMALAWVALGSKNTGLINIFIEKLVGVQAFINIFSFPGVLWVMVISHVPIA